jgi:hypothetical protein
VTPSALAIIKEFENVLTVVPIRHHRYQTQLRLRSSMMVGVRDTAEFVSASLDRPCINQKIDNE